MMRHLHTALHACVALIAVPLAAQAARTTPATSCAATTVESSHERVAIELIYAGENRREMWQAIEIAGASARVCIVAKSAALAADSSVYGVLQINRLEGGGYELATSLAGPRAPRQRCRSARAASVPGDTPVIWGVLLTITLPAFTECVLNARQSTSSLSP